MIEPRHTLVPTAFTHLPNDDRTSPSLVLHLTLAGSRAQGGARGGARARA
jgi:hypothetical protein